MILTLLMTSAYLHKDEVK